MQVPGFNAETHGATVALSGELDLVGVHALEQALRSAQEADGPLIIDLRELEFIDSSGLGVLVRFHNAATTSDFAYSVIPGPPAVHRAFVLAGLDRTLPFSD
jgi:anti-sigma B factor antagonist